MSSPSEKTKLGNIYWCFTLNPKPLTLNPKPYTLKMSSSHSGNLLRQLESLETLCTATLPGFCGSLNPNSALS